MIPKGITGLAKNRLRQLNSFGLMRLGSAVGATQLITLVAGIGTSVLLARVLGTAGYGNYIFAMTIAEMLAMPILAGLPALVTRQVAIYRAREDEARLNGVIGWAFRTVAFSSLVVATAGIVYMVVRREHERAGLLYLLVFPLVIALARLRITSAVIQGFERPFHGSLPDSVIRPAALAVMLAAAAGLGWLDPTAALGIHLVAIVGSLAWASWFLRFRVGHAPKRGSASTVEQRAWLRSVLPFTLITAAGMLNSRLDILMLGTLADKSQVAVYGWAVQMSGFVLLGQVIFNTIIGPQIARSHSQGDKARLQSLARQSGQLAFFSAVLVLTAIAVVGKPIIELVIGASFAQSYQIALIIGVGHVLNASVGPVALTLNMTGHEKLTAMVIWLSVLMNGAMNLIMIPAWGAIGAAMATLITSAVQQIFLLNRLNKLEGVRSAVFQRAGLLG